LEDCIFCKIVRRHQHSTVVYEDEKSLGFLDHIPLNPGHTLVIPKKHYDTMREMPPAEVGELFVSVAKVMRGVFKASGADGINIGQSNGAAASQDVFHMHVHIIPRYNHDSPGGLTFPERKKTSLAEREKMGVLIREAIREEQG
jgi:histidine triad (HIT) family protein